MLIEITYNVTDVYMSTTETPIYVEISFEQPGGSSAVWGAITGTLSDQTDLQNALNAKLDESTIDGGTEGQILSKASATDFDFAWINNYAKYLATNVRNQTGSTIGAFQVVYISGATGNKPLISLADADTEATSSKTYGVTATSIANNGTGDVVTAGELSGINTSAFNEGDLLWLSTTAGGVVTSPPAEPAHAVFIGTVIRSHPTLGVIDVAISNGYELKELHGVDIVSEANNDGLFYNSSNLLWENKTVAEALGYTPANAATTLTINGVTYDLSTSRSWTVAAGISGTIATGQVSFGTASNTIGGSNNLFWDAANNRLGIGTNAPLSRMHILPATNATSCLIIEEPNTTPNGLGQTNIYITGKGQTISGSNNSEFSFFVGGPGSTTTSDGPAFGMRGNNFIRNANQRGWILFYSGNPSNPVGNDGAITFGATTFFDIQTGTNYTSKLRVLNTGNVLIQNGGTFTDGGQRLQVIGDTLLRGSGNTSATTALTVQNSDSNFILSARNDRRVWIYSNSNITGLVVGDTVGSSAGTNISSNEIRFNPGGTILHSTTSGNNADNGGIIIKSNSTLNPTVNNPKDLAVSSTFAPTSGTGTYVSTIINPTINQTGGANGITRGLYVNPTLTSAADFRAIETSAGNVLFGSNFFWDNTNGRLGIGTNAPAYALDVRTSSGFIAAAFKSQYAATGYIGTDNNGVWLGIGADGFRTAFYTDGSTNSLIFRSNSVQIGRVYSTGNWVLQNGGTFSDGGQRLQVIGDTLLRGSGATSSTTALTVQNSSSTNLLTVRNDGLVTFGNIANNVTHLQIGGASASIGDFSAPAIKFGNTTTGIYTDSSRVFFVSNGTFGGGFAAGYYQGNSAYISASSGANDFNIPKMGGYRLNAAGLEAGLGGNSAGDVSLVTNILARLVAKYTGQIRFVPLASAPSGAEAGDVYYDSTDNKHYGYNGTTWNAFY